MKKLLENFYFLLTLVSLTTFLVGCEIQTEVSQNPYSEQNPNNSSNVSDLTKEESQVKIPLISKGRAGDNILVPIQVSNLNVVSSTRKKGSLERIKLTIDFNEDKFSPSGAVFQYKDDQGLLDDKNFKLDFETREPGKLLITITRKNILSENISFASSGILAYFVLSVIEDFDLSVASKETEFLKIADCVINNETAKIIPSELELDQLENDLEEKEIQILPEDEISSDFIFVTIVGSGKLRKNEVQDFYQIILVRKNGQEKKYYPVNLRDEFSAFLTEDLDSLEIGLQIDFTAKFLSKLDRESYEIPQKAGFPIKLISLMKTDLIAEPDDSSDICPTVINPVCANGVTFDNECIALQAGIPAKKITPGSCQEMNCTEEHKPVCFNGQTYGNKCKALKDGATESEVELGPCPQVCSTEYAPVCAIAHPICIAANCPVEQITFSNQCEAENFYRTTNIQVEYLEGECEALSDNTAPVPGSGGVITAKEIYPQCFVAENCPNPYLELKWSGATDEVTSQSDLVYSVKYIEGDIALEDAVWSDYGSATKNMLGIEIRGLAIDTLYTFKVIVADEAGNENEYQTLSKVFPPDYNNEIFPLTITPKEPVVGFESGELEYVVNVTL